MLAVSECPCVVTTVAAHDDMMWIRLVGAVELGAEAALNKAIDRVQELAPQRVVIDLAGVIFAGSLLAKFLIRLHNAAGPAAIHLHHADSTIRFVLTATHVDDLVTFDDRSRPRAA